MTTLTKTMILMMFALLLGIFAADARAASFTVMNTADAGAGSLRQAILDANLNADADTIVFASPLFDTAQTINITSARLQITNPLTITGPGARLLTVRRGSTTNITIFSNAAASVSISGMTVSNGRQGAEFGGAFNNSGALTIDRVAVTGDQSTESAINNRGTTMTITNSGTVKNFV